MIKVIDSIVEVFQTVTAWLGSALSTVQEFFWNAEGNTLTFLGTLAVAGLAVSVAMLVLNLVKDYLHFR